jgi:hypothetical protein
MMNYEFYPSPLLLAEFPRLVPNRGFLVEISDAIARLNLHVGNLFTMSYTAINTI